MDTEALKGTRSVDRTRGKKDFCFISAFQNSFSLSRMNLDVNINLERLVLGIVFLWTKGNQISFRVVFHLTFV